MAVFQPLTAQGGVIPNGWTIDQWNAYLASQNQTGLGKYEAELEAENEAARNAAAMAQLQAQIAAQGTQATAAQQAEMARLQATIGSTEKLASQTQAFQAGESAAERAARLGEIGATGEQQKALEALRQSGAMGLQTSQQQFAGQESAAERAARLAEIGATGAQQQTIEALRNTGAATVAGINTAGTLAATREQNLGAMEQLKAQIASQQGIATQAQQAEMDRLQAQLSTQKEESAAERQARLAELAATQSGTKELAGYQAQLQQETEEQRYLRALEQSKQASGQVNDWMTKLGVLDANGQPAGSGGTGAADQEERAAEDAAFARAKEKIGLASRTAQESLSAEMAQRGITGSGVEAQGLGKVYESGVGQISDVAREQALSSLNRRYQVSDRNANLAAQKRAQDIGLLSSLSAMTKPTGGGIY